jgi:hypothetical protein
VHEEIHQYLKCMAQLIEAMAVPVEKKPNQNPVVQMLQINQETGFANNCASRHELRRGSLGTEMLEQLEKIRQAIEQQTRVLELTTYAMNSILSRDEWEHLLFDKSKNPEAFKEAQEKFLKFAELAPFALTKSESGSLPKRGSPNFLLGYPGFENEYLPLCFALLDTSVNYVRKKGKLPTKDQVLFKIEKLSGLNVINAKNPKPRPIIVGKRDKEDVEDEEDEEGKKRKKEGVAPSVWSENWEPAGLKDLPNARPHKGKRKTTC